MFPPGFERPIGSLQQQEAGLYDRGRNCGERDFHASGSKAPVCPTESYIMYALFSNNGPPLGLSMDEPNVSAMRPNNHLALEYDTEQIDHCFAWMLCGEGILIVHGILLMTNLGIDTMVAGAQEASIG